MNKGVNWLSEEQIKAMTVLSIGLFGLVSLVYSLYELQMADLQLKVVMDSLIVTVLLAALFSKSVTLPSGSLWRPSIGLIIYSAFVFPYYDVVLISFSGIFVSQIKTGVSWKTSMVSLGHLSLGILTIRAVVHFIAPVFGYSLPLAVVWMGLGLVSHFFINRFVSAVISSCVKKRKLLQQIKLIQKDFNWGYVSTYILGACMVFMYQAYGPWGMLVTIPLLFSIYYSVMYFEKANQLRRISLTDALTGAENRTSWEKFKGKFCLNGGEGTFVFVDLDHFKGINDLWGHDVGDRILCETVHCLQQIRPGESRVFRYGGDEFILYIPHHEAEQVDVQQMINQKILEKNQEWLEGNYEVAISLGMKFVSAGATSGGLDETLIHLDQQMYWNKALNKKQVY
jgi:diguanylate cyclase (GGDEF)-like protein